MSGAGNRVPDDLKKFSLVRIGLKVSDEILGDNFSQVHRATFKKPEEKEGKEVAAKKMLLIDFYNELTPDAKLKFAEEVKLMASLDHPNLVKMIGVSMTEDPCYLVMELVPGWSLNQYVKESVRPKNHLLDIAKKVLAGLKYLEGNAIAHRNISARCVLVAQTGEVKISGFSYACKLTDGGIYEMRPPVFKNIRWMAPEAFQKAEFSYKSDVWSFGVLLWEMFMQGAVPYGQRSNDEVKKFVLGGGRLSKPEGYDNEYAIMQLCWKEDPTKRPSYAEMTTPKEPKPTPQQQPKPPAQQPPVQQKKDESSCSLF